jgi:hypothetical protein
MSVLIEWGLLRVNLGKNQATTNVIIQGFDNEIRCWEN